MGMGREYYVRRERLLLTRLVCCGDVLRQQEILACREVEGSRQKVSAWVQVVIIPSSKWALQEGEMKEPTQAVVESW